MSPEIARALLRDHPDLTTCNAQERHLIAHAYAHRPDHITSPLALLKDAAARMTAVESYCIGKIQSEAGEFGQIAGNAQCFGIDTPDNGGSARERMELEAGDIHAALRLAILHGVFSEAGLMHRSDTKLAKLLDPAQRDNLGRPLAPPLAQSAGDVLLSLASAARIGLREDETYTIQVSGRVADALSRLLDKRDVTVDILLRRLLKIDQKVELATDGPVGYIDPKSGLTLPQGFTIYRVVDGQRHEAVARDGAWITADGVAHVNLARLTKSLKRPIPENAWSVWKFVDADGQQRLLSTLRPLPKPRQRRAGRPPRDTDPPT